MSRVRVQCLVKCDYCILTAADTLHTLVLKEGEQNMGLEKRNC